METRITECLKFSLVRPERRTKKHTSFQYGAYRRVRECRVDVDCQRSIKSEKNVLHQKTKTVCSQERKVGKNLPRKCTEGHCRFASLKRIPGRFTLGLLSFILQSKPPLTLASFSQGQKTCETLTSYCWPLRPLTL